MEWIGNINVNMVGVPYVGDLSLVLWSAMISQETDLVELFSTFMSKPTFASALPHHLGTDVSTGSNLHLFIRCECCGRRGGEKG